MDAEKQGAPVQPGRLANPRSRLRDGQDRPPTPAFAGSTLFSGSTRIAGTMTTQIRGDHYGGELNNFTQIPDYSHKDGGRGCGPCSLVGKECRHYTDALREQVSYDDIIGMHRRFARSL